MAINQKHITDEFKDRDEVISKIKLWTRASRGSFDNGKFKFLGKTNQELKNNSRDKFEDPWLIRFERETNASYITRLELMSNLGITEMIVASYTDTFNKVKKTAEIKGAR